MPSLWGRSSLCGCRAAAVEDVIQRHRAEDHEGQGLVHAVIARAGDHEAEQVGPQADAQIEDCLLYTSDAADD